MSNISFAGDLVKWQTTELPGKNSLRGSAINGKSLWVTGSENSVFRSTDLGKTWQDVSVKAKVVTDFRDIEVFDENTAIVMGVGSGELSMLYKTVDAGKSWQLLLSNKDKTGFFDSMDFWDNNTGLLLGDPVDGYYVLNKTTDGGKTFKRIQMSRLPTMQDKESAFAASGNTLIVAGRGKAWITTGGFAASVYNSVDYGETWWRQAVPLHQKTQTSGGYALALNAKQQLFVLGGDYLHRSDQYTNIAMKVGQKWVVPKNSNNGLRTAMSCIGKICINTGMQYSDISYDDGVSWQTFAESGYYTLTADDEIFLGAGHDGRIGVAGAKGIDAASVKK